MSDQQDENFQTRPQLKSTTSDDVIHTSTTPCLFNFHLSHNSTLFHPRVFLSPLQCTKAPSDCTCACVCVHVCAWCFVSRMPRMPRMSCMCTSWMCPCLCVYVCVCVCVCLFQFSFFRKTNVNEQKHPELEREQPHHQQPQRKSSRLP